MVYLYATYFIISLVFTKKSIPTYQSITKGFSAESLKKAYNEFTTFGDTASLENWKNALPSKELKTFFEDVQNGKRELSSLPTYIKECTTSSSSLGTSIDLTTVKTTLLNSVLNAGIYAAVTVAINLLVTAWDQFNVTVAEVQANIDNLNSKLSTLNTCLLYTSRCV